MSFFLFCKTQGNQNLVQAVTIQWTGLLDWTTGLTETVSAWGEKGTPMHRAKTPGHKVCSSVVVTHLKVVSSSVPSYSALFILLLLYLDGNLGMATPRPRANKCAWALLVCDAVFQSGWVFFICPYCSPLLSPLLFFVMNAECGTRCSSQIVICFHSGLCLWNGKLGFEALLSFVTRITAPIFDHALALGSN